MADYLVCQRTKQINDCGLITCAFATFTSRNNVKLCLYWTGVYIKPSLEIKWEWASKPNGQTKLFIEKLLLLLKHLIIIHYLNVFLIFIWKSLKSSSFTTIGNFHEKNPPIIKILYCTKTK